MEENRYLTERQVEGITGRSVYTLRNDRQKHQGFPYTKNGRQVRYALRDIIEHMEARKIIPDDMEQRKVKTQN